MTITLEQSRCRLCGGGGGGEGIHSRMMLFLALLNMLRVVTHISIIKVGNIDLKKNMNKIFFSFFSQNNMFLYQPINWEKTFEVCQEDYLSFGPKDLVLSITLII